jgi:hypothetical protein
VLRGSGVEVDSLRNRTAAACSEGGGVKVNDLRKRTTVARSKARVEVAACSRADDEVAACSGVGIEDDRWWRRHDNF